jgi:hypothetical protein
MVVGTNVAAIEILAGSSIAGAQGLGLLSFAAAPVNPCEKISPPHSYPAFDNDIRDLFVPNHLIDL